MTALSAQLPGPAYDRSVSYRNIRIAKFAKSEDSSEVLNSKTHSEKQVGLHRLFKPPPKDLVLRPNDYSTRRAHDKAVSHTPAMPLPSLPTPALAARIKSLKRQYDRPSRIRHYMKRGPSYVN